MTKTDIKIAELTLALAVLEERLNNERSELKRVDSERSKSAEQDFEVVQKLGVIDHNLQELKKTLEENDHRRWAVILALIGCLLTLAVNLGMIFVKSGPLI